MDASFGYSFPAIRGVQAGREYYVSMCPLRLIPKIFLFDEDELVPEVRAQRVLNRVRIPEMARYLVDNPSDYIFSALTASVDGQTTFQALAEEGDAAHIGVLRISMDARFIINDGQHRRAAIEAAMHERPELADENIAVVFFQDTGLKRTQQMFSDLNRYAIRPSRSLNILYDHRDELALLTKDVVRTCKAFRGVVEMEKTALATRSMKLFTLSAIHTANKALLRQVESDVHAMLDIVCAYWEHVDDRVPEWGMVRAREMTASEVRQTFIHSHGVALHALGKVGSTLLQSEEQEWSRHLDKFAGLDWRRDSSLWDGRAIVGGTVNKSVNNVTLTANVIKKLLGLPLNKEENRVETAFLREKE